ncbi:hypothetical protein SAMN04490357_7684 [Streptomyces misionensis]|uniref:Uncharacterized protein n=1 Tax=Streptomyces misionensis TaxID=67331 RepID=A0A1H5K2Y9_9ACTN|nr:hypothetical protein [Streptomyces misionensis]SEE59179.1 hypothetical protein SAMN04490357_7684 [Streptomyces misionensis]
MTRPALALRDLVRAGLDLTGRMPSQMLLLLVPLLAALAYGSGTVLLDALTALVTAVAQVTKCLLWLGALGVSARLLHRVVDQHLRNNPPVAPSETREPAA